MLDAWSHERIDLLRKMVPEGHSYSVIAAHVSALPGPSVSRNAAIGKATRLGINIQHTRTFHKGARKKVLAPRRPMRRVAPTSQAVALAQLQREAIRATPDLITPPEERKSLLALEAGCCRWPYGDAAPFAFCGKPKLPGLPYCSGHAARAFDAVSGRCGRQTPVVQPVPDDRVDRREVSEAA